MTVKTEFLGSAGRKSEYPAFPHPQVALAGRSNVGKSSLVNSLAHRRNLARISSTPGKTRNINFYLLRGQVILVDLPGYGFARASKKERNRWKEMIDEYLQEGENLSGLIQILDLRHPPSEQDKSMYDWLLAAELPFLLVATKADKVKKGRWGKHLDQIRKELDPDLEKEQPVIFSAEKGYGKEKVWSFLNRLSG